MISAFFADTSIWLLFFIIVVIPVILACLCVLLIRQQREKVLIEIHDNEAIGFVFAAVSVVYAVVLAFLVISVWEAFGSAQHAVAQEAAAIVTTARYSASLPEPVRGQVHDQLRQYTEFVMSEEWQLMQHPTEDPEGSLNARHALQAIWTTAQQKLPPNAITATVLTSVADLSNHRLLRLVSGDVVPDYVWLVLVLGGIVVIYFALVLRVENPRLHLVLVALLTGSIALCLWLMAATANPFSGEIQVSIAPLRYALHVIDAMPR